MQMLSNVSFMCGYMTQKVWRSDSKSVAIWRGDLASGRSDHKPNLLPARQRVLIVKSIFLFHVNRIYKIRVMSKRHEKYLRQV